MAKSGLTHIDVGPELTRTEWESEESHALINGTSFPVAPVERQLFYRNDLHEWFIFTGSAWATLQGAGGGLVVHDNAFHSPDFEEEGYADLAIAAHRTAAVHVADQPPDVHDNAKHSPDYEEQGVAATQIETHRTTAVHAADQPPDLHDNAKHSPDYEQEGVAATQIETHRTAAEHTQDQPSTFLKLSDTPAAFTGQAGKYPKVNVGESALEFDTPGGAGDMLKSVYDPNDDGVLALAQLDPLVCSEAEADAKVSTHAALTNAHSATATATPDRIVLRDAAGRAKFAAPAAAGDALIKGTAITDVEHGSRGSALHADSHAQNTDTRIQDADADTKVDVEEAGDEDTVRMDVAGVEAFKLSSVGVLTLAKQSGAAVYQAANQVIPNAALVLVCHDTESFDGQNEFDSTVKIGAADATEALKLHDADGGFAAGDVGAQIWNTTDNTYALVTAFVDSGELTLDTDIMVDTEGYKLFRSKFTATEAGKYMCVAKVQFESIADQKTIASYIYKNGSIVATSSINQSHPSAGTCAVVAVGIVTLAANDILRHKVKQWVGNVESMYEGSDGVFFQMIKVA